MYLKWINLILKTKFFQVSYKKKYVICYLHNILFLFLEKRGTLKNSKCQNSLNWNIQYSYIAYGKSQ